MKDMTTRAEAANTDFLVLAGPIMPMTLVMQISEVTAPQCEAEVPLHAHGSASRDEESCNVLL